MLLIYSTYFLVFINMLRLGFVKVYVLTVIILVYPYVINIHVLYQLFTCKP